MIKARSLPGKACAFDSARKPNIGGAGAMFTVSVPMLEEFGHVISAGGSGVVIFSQSGHPLPALRNKTNQCRLHTAKWRLHTAEWLMYAAEFFPRSRLSRT